MARLPRLILAGQPHLVVQATRDGQFAFLDDDDRRSYLAALLEASRACVVTLHAYSLLDEQVSLLATPATADALGRFMQRVGRRYVGGFNQRYGRSGALWAGRYQVAVLDAQSRVLMGMRLVEQVPLRRGMVAEAADWPWSSAAHHIGRVKAALIREHEAYWRLGNTPFAREVAYAKQLAEPLPTHEVDVLEAAVRGGWPIGPPAFRDALAGVAARPVQPAKRGRPRRPGSAPVR